MGDNAVYPVADPLAAPDNVAKANGIEHGRTPKVKKEVARSWGEIIRKWPKISFFIVANEFCERFSYYGMRTVLTLYLVNILKFDHSDSTAFFNTFSAMCYFSPILGAIIADGYIGKFKTIFIVSIFYAAGQILLAISSTQGKGWGLHPWLDLLGLAIIALGTGGIKPCVSPFGGDQFESHQVVMISIFFSVFYFSINAGALISTFMSPMFRALPCLGQDSCYPMAFGIPAVLMIVATCFFMLGSFWYKKKPPGSNIFKDVAVVIKRALSNKMSGGERREHWLDYAMVGHRCEYSHNCTALKAKTKDNDSCAEAKFVDDVKSLFRVIIMYIPLPVFWALYDQQGSVWTLQAVQMDCRLWEGALLLPDQMQTLNAVLILAFIPLFQVVIYPLWGLCMKVTPLRKMVVGGLLASASFVITGLVQIEVNKSLAALPDSGYAFVSAVNTIPNNCNITIIVGDDLNGLKAVATGQGLHHRYEDPELFNVKRGEETTFTFAGSGCGTGVPTTFKTKVTGEVNFLHFSPNGVFLSEVTTSKPTDGNGDHSLGFVTAFDSGDYKKHLVLCRGEGEGVKCDSSLKSSFYFYEFTDDDELMETFQYAGKQNRAATFYKPASVRPGKWRLFYASEKPGSGKDLGLVDTGYGFTREEEGGVYVVTLSGEQSKPVITSLQMVDDNKVSILWQIPQIAVLTAGEVLFSITGLEFSYTQAAPSMKSVVGALFLTTTGIGDMMIVVITIITKGANMAIVFFCYAVLMAAVIFVFALLSIFYYTYTDYDKVKDEDEDEDEYSEDQSFGSTKPILADVPLGHPHPKEEEEWKTRL